MSACAASGCIGTNRDVHLAPLYSNLSTAGGGREVEMLFGALRFRRPAPQAAVNDWAIRPLASGTTAPNGDSLARFVVPLGTRRRTGEEYVFQLLPLVRYQRDKDEEMRSRWRFMLFPLVLWSKEPSGRVVRAFFPFGGVIEDFLTFDRVTFALFPLFMKTERDDVTTYHFLFPLFAHGRGKLGKFERELRTDRVFPLYGRTSIEGAHDRRFLLWPFFHLHRNRLALAEEKRETKWLFWPLYGRTTQGSFRAHTVLWPFFGWSSNPANGFWALDAPWPFVRLQRPGESKTADRTRLWPLYSHFEGGGLKSTWVLFPFINAREETYSDGLRKARYLIPFYQSWEHTRDDGSSASWTKVWPLFQRKTDPGKERFALLALNPLWHQPVIDDHYAWLYELITREVDGPNVKVRSWGGFWRQENDEHERRSSLAGVWARRRYQLGNADVTETSLLFGLLRWRSGPGTQLLAPAFPGPGWPVDRTRRRVPESSEVPAR